MSVGQEFGMTNPGNSSDAWCEPFHDWLGANGLTHAPGARSGQKAGRLGSGTR
jgi:hypothetical protein